MTEPIAPHLMPFDVVTAIRHLEFAGRIRHDVSDTAVAEVLRLRVRLCASRSLPVAGVV